MSWLSSVGTGALLVLGAGWLMVSFSAPGPRRTAVEWISASAGFTALASLFVHLVSRAWEQDSTAALIGFGFLCVLFGSGLCVSLTFTLRALLGGGDRSQASATN